MAVYGYMNFPFSGVPATNGPSRLYWNWAGKAKAPHHVEWVTRTFPPQLQSARFWVRRDPLAPKRVHKTSKLKDRKVTDQQKRCAEPPMSGLWFLGLRLELNKA